LAEDGVEATVASATEGTDSSHFIRGSATGIDGIYTEFSGGLARVTGLRLSDADTDNGVAFGYVTTGPGDNTALHFAGLLSGADVGAPITNIVTDVLWTGRIAGFIDEKRVNNSIQGSTLFLRISFTGDRGTIINWNGDGDPEESQGDAAAVSVGNSRFLSLVGGFTPAGVLTGTVKTGTNAVVTQGIQSGTFNGIIGQDGLLAVFKSDDANTVHFAGGFAAVPGTTAPNSPFEVNVQAPDDNTGGGNGEEVTGTTAYQAWATSLGDDLRASNYTPPTTGASADFIRLNDSDDADSIANNIVATNFTADNGAISVPLYLKDSLTSGVVYGHALDTHNRLYAGLLPTTNVGVGTDLGAPITDDTKDGTWTGTLAGFDIDGDPISPFFGSFNMTVAFGEGSKAGTIKSLSQGFNDTFM
nr:hypothetical protein [Pseudomonadota bacterium]